MFSKNGRQKKEKLTIENKQFLAVNPIFLFLGKLNAFISPSIWIVLAALPSV